MTHKLLYSHIFVFVSDDASQKSCQCLVPYEGYCLIFVLFATVSSLHAMDSALWNILIGTAGC